MKHWRTSRQWHDSADHFGDVSRRESGGARISDQTISLRSWERVTRGALLRAVEVWMTVAPPAWPMVTVESWIRPTCASGGVRIARIFGGMGGGRRCGLGLCWIGLGA